MTEQAQAQTNNVNITLQDIITVVQVIDACSERGAFKGEELAVVGQVREKFNQIVQANMPKEEKAEEKTEEAGS